MTFSEWDTSFQERRQKIVEKLEGSSIDEVIEYFNFDNMRAKEPDFCPLYRDNIKCHNLETLNCFYCGCPYYQWSDLPFRGKKGQEIYSLCSINSKQASQYNTEGKTYCDCSSCTIPHTKSFALRFVKTATSLSIVEDSCSFLEELRAYQLGKIFGKFKIF